MYDYTIVPSDKIKKRMDFFYTPYNTKFLLRKHMTFEEDEELANATQDTGKKQSRSQTPSLKNSKELEEQRKEDLYNMVKQLQAL